MTDKLKIKRGEELLWNDWLNYQASGGPVDLTGYTASSQMRSYPAGNLVAEGEMTINASAGTVQTLYTSEVTDGIDAGEYGFDVWLELDGQKVCIDTVLVTILNRYTGD